MYCQGVKDVDGGEYTFLSPSGEERGSSWELRPLGMNSYDSNTGLSKDQEEEKQHCIILGVKLAKSAKEERREEEEEAERPLHHFFDEWPHKAKGSWIDIWCSGSSLLWNKCKNDLRYELVQADLAIASFSDLSMINLRRLFAHKGSDFMDLQKQLIEKSPPKRKLMVDTIW